MSRALVQAVITSLVLITVAALLLIRPDFNFGGNTGDKALKAILKADTNAGKFGESLNQVSLVNYQSGTRDETESQPNYVQASDALKEDWDARYKVAIEDYEQMLVDIKEADEVAKEYIDLQRGYTEKISNPQLRKRAAESDKAEIEAYLQWKSRANGIILTAEPIMRHLKDIDAVIQKQNLSAHFLALRESLDRLPVSVSNLHAQVELFHRESMAIQDAFNQLPAETDIDPSTQTTNEEAVH